MLVLFSVLCLLAAAQGNIAQINGAVDKVLQDARQMILKNKSEVMTIPHFIEDGFTYRWHLFKLAGSFECLNGTMTNTSTLMRTGDVDIAVNRANQTTVAIPLNLTDFQMNFNSCRIVIKDLLRKTSPIKVKIGKNSFEAKVIIDPKNTQCQVTLETFRLTKAERVTFESSYLFEEVNERLLPYLIKHFIRQLVPFMSQHIKDLLKDYVPNGKLCYK